uniref:Uncharacterized protein n=1 Tax=Anguilla anguilla TaxID=7936 RepID=A0A0E9UQW8_ANGAN
MQMRLFHYFTHDFCESDFYYTILLRNMTGTFHK